MLTFNLIFFWNILFAGAKIVLVFFFYFINFDDAYNRKVNESALLSIEFIYLIISKLASFFLKNYSIIY